MRKKKPAAELYSEIRARNDAKTAAAFRAMDTEVNNDETPIKLEEFLERLREEVDAYEKRRDLGGYQPRPFYAWFREFESDVFAPEGP
jgi:hypothetical protein